jgi:hypothetical protein
MFHCFNLGSKIGGDLRRSKIKVWCTRQLAGVMTVVASIRMAKVATVP